MEEGVFIFLKAISPEEVKRFLNIGATTTDLLDILYGVSSREEMLGDEGYDYEQDEEYQKFYNKYCTKLSKEGQGPLSYQELKNLLKSLESLKDEYSEKLLPKVLYNLAILAYQYQGEEEYEKYYDMLSRSYSDTGNSGFEIFNQLEKTVGELRNQN